MFSETFGAEKTGFLYSQYPFYFIDRLRLFGKINMAKCIKDKSEVMTNIAGAMEKSLAVGGLGLSRGDLLEELLELIKKRWIGRLFPEEAPKNEDLLLIDTSEKNSRQDLLQSAYERAAMGGRMTRQLDACVNRAISEKDAVE